METALHKTGEKKTIFIEKQNKKTIPETGFSFIFCSLYFPLLLFRFGSS